MPKNFLGSALNLLTIEVTKFASLAISITELNLRIMFGSLYVIDFLFFNSPSHKVEHL